MRNKVFNRRNRKIFSLLGIQLTLVLLFYLTMGAFLVSAGVLFKNIIGFGTNNHNIDLALNMANIGCSFCLSEITDEGRTWENKKVNITLADSYSSSMILNTRNYYYSIIIAFFMGMALISGLLLMGGIVEKENELKQFKK